MTCNCGGNTMNMPIAGQSVVTADGTLTPTWYRFLLDTYTRTGAQGHAPTGVTVSDQITTAQNTANSGTSAAAAAQASADAANAAINTEITDRTNADLLLLLIDGTRAMTGPLRLPVYSAGALPAGVTGARAFVNDALAPVFGSPVAAGGAVRVPVYYNGVNWCVG